MMSSPVVRCLLMSLLFSVVLGACNQPETPPAPVVPAASSVPVTGDSLVEGTIGEASTLIPLLATDSASHAVAGQIYNGLVKYDKNLNIVGDLAESFDISKDGLIITFHLRHGVKWHDGAPLTSKDVLYTYQVTIDPKTPTAYAEDFKQVKNISAPDDHTIKVTYDKPFAPALASWGMSILPAHLLEGQDITKSPLARKPVGTGPYRFKEWIAGQKIVLEVNPDYFEGRPYIDRYIYRIIPDTSTMYMELKAGAVDTDDPDTGAVRSPDHLTTIHLPLQQIPLSFIRLPLHGLQSAPSAVWRQTHPSGHDRRYQQG